MKLSLKDIDSVSKTGISANLSYMDTYEYPLVKPKIEELIDGIYYSIKEYNAPEDIHILDKLKEICSMYKICLCKLYFILGEYYYNLGIRGIAIEYLRTALKQPCDDLNLIVEINSMIGFVFFMSKDYNEAFDYYKRAEDIISSSSEIRNKLVFLHYYRKGILQNNTYKHDEALLSFTKSLEYASDVYFLGNALMNIGLVYKRKGLYREALNYYFDSLKVFGNDDSLSMGKVYNNIAETLRVAGINVCALSYINVAIGCFGEENRKEKLIALDTYYKIKISMNEKTEEIDKLICLIGDIDSVSTYKRFTTDAITTVIDYSIRYNDKETLIKLKRTIKKLIDTNEKEIEYKKELKAFLCDIYEFLYSEHDGTEKRIDYL